MSLPLMNACFSVAGARRAFRAFVLCCSGIAGCAWLHACGGVPETSYYTIAPLALPNVPNVARTSNAANALVLGVEKFSAEALYEDDRIIYRTSPYEVQYYHYRRWAATPRQLVTEQVLARLQQTGAFQNVVSFPSNLHVDYVLTGRVVSFEEWDRGAEWFGRAAFIAQLYDPATHKIIWSEAFEAETRAAQRLPTAVVEAIGKSLEQCIAALQQALPGAIKK